MSPATWDEYGHWVVAMSPLRERRLLAMAWHQGGFNHKRFYGQYCFLMGHGLVQWSLGTAFLTQAGKERLAELEAAGV